MADLTERLPDNLYSFTLINNSYYESLDHYQRINNYFVELVEKETPEGWNAFQSGIWYHMVPPHKSDKQQGFKIHISTLPKNAKKILKISANICINHRVQLKFLCDRRILRYSLSKAYSRGASGKFLVIYPKNRDEFKSLLEILYKKTKQINGPYILSDCTYKDSSTVFYRYGGFKTITKINIKGQKQACIKDPDENLIPDVRTPYYKLPFWIDDPFGSEEISTEVDNNNEIILSDRFKIIELVKHSNIGGVYRAIDFKNNDKKVIIKETRSNTGYSGSKEKFIEASKVARKEYNILKKLENLPFIPTAYSFFKEWKHWYIAMEKVDATSIGNYRARANIIPSLEPDIPKIKKYMSIVIIFFIYLKKYSLFYIKFINKRLYLGTLLPKIFYTTMKLTGFT